MTFGNHGDLIDAGYILNNGNWIHRTAIITPFVSMGKGNIVDPFCVIGTDGEMKGESEFKGRVIIGDNNHFGEFMTVQRPADERHETWIGNDCYLMARTHIPHHATIGDGVIMATGATIGGRVVVGRAAYLGLNSVVHPRLFIGRLACLGMNATATKDVPNFQTWVGTPAKFFCWNTTGMLRAGFTETEIKEITENPKE